MRVKSQVRTWALGLTLVGVLAVAACGGGEGDGGEQTIDSLDVTELLDTAVIQFTDMESFRFELDFAGDTSPLEQLQVDMQSIKGDVIIPDKLKAEVQARATQFGGLQVNVDLIGVGEDAWFTNPLNRSEWIPLDGGNPLNGLFNPSDGVAAVIRGAANPTVTGEEVLEGVATWMVEGTIDSGDLTAFLESAEPGYPVKGTIWIGKEDNVIYRIYLLGQLTAGEPEDILRRLNFSNFNNVEPIEPP